MKKVLLLTTTFILTALLCVGLPAQNRTTGGREGMSTLRAKMEVIHEQFGVNFIYDSSLELDRIAGHAGNDAARHARPDRASLEETLDALFAGTGIEYRIMKKYIVLTRSDSRKKPKDYTIFIEEQHDTLSESVVTAMRDPLRNTTQTGLKRLDSKDINSGFALFSSPDVIKTLQMMPGVSSGTELLSGFYVHGGDGSDNLFMLDGVPVYKVSHLLGIFSAFNTDVIGSMDFYKSGFPARFGSKLSSVVDITTKDGDFNAYHGTFRLGLLDGSLQFEGPIWKGKTSFNIGLRRTWTEIVSVPLIAILSRSIRPDKENFRYAFTDCNARITHKFSDKNVLTANFYAGRDFFKYYQDYYWESYDGERERDVINAPLAWGNTIGSLSWHYEPKDNISMKTTAYYSGTYTNLDISYQEWYNNPEEGEYTIKSGEYTSSDVHNIGLRYDVNHLVHPRHRLRYGATVQGHIYRPTATAKSEYISESLTYAEVAYADTLKYNSIKAAVYAEDEMSLTDAFSMNLGLRYSIYSVGRKVWHSVEPRVAMKYAFCDKISAKASYTEMSQPVHLVSSIYLDLPTNSWLPSTPKVRPSRSREVAAGIYTDLAYNLHLNVEGWYKHMYNLLEYAGAYSVFPPMTDWESNFKTGNGRSWGAELDFGFDNGRTEANVYYTLSWSQRKFDDFYHSWYRDRNDSRHKLTLMAKHKFGKRFEIYGAWNYHSGPRVTMATHIAGGQEIYTQPNNVKLPDYHRLDVGMNFVKNTKRGNTSIWNLSLYNAYCHTNPITAYEDMLTKDGECLARYGTAIGVIPIIPTFSYTLKF